MLWRWTEAPERQRLDMPDDIWFDGAVEPVTAL
jgi:hypothetical protein